MTTTQLGLVTGLLLGIAGALGGFGAFVVVLLLGALGLLVGSYLDGGIDLGELTERSRVARDRGRRL